MTLCICVNVCPLMIEYMSTSQSPIGGPRVRRQNLGEKSPYTEKTFLRGVWKFIFNYSFRMRRIK